MEVVPLICWSTFLFLFSCFCLFVRWFGFRGGSTAFKRDLKQYLLMCVSHLLMLLTQAHDEPVYYTYVGGYKKTQSPSATTQRQRNQLQKIANDGINCSTFIILLLYFFFFFVYFGWVLYIFLSLLSPWFRGGVPPSFS